MILQVPYRNLLRAVAFVVFGSLPLVPAGQTFTANSGMPVRIEIVQLCSLSVADLDFGNYTSSGAAALGQTAIQLQCAPGVSAELSLDGGMAPGSGKTTRRRMSSDSGGGNRLDYDLFQDAGRTVHWGDTYGEDTLEVLTTGQPQTIPIYGAIPGGQRVHDGTYSDTITVRLQL